MSWFQFANAFENLIKDNTYDIRISWFSRCLMSRYDRHKHSEAECGLVAIQNILKFCYSERYQMDKSHAYWKSKLGTTQTPCFMNIWTSTSFGEPRQVVHP